MNSIKKKCSVLFVMAIFLLSSVAFVSAADCTSAAIKKVGVNPAVTTVGASNYFLQLDCDNDATWAGTISFYLTSDLGDSGLATLLTAYSLGKKVWARTNGVTAGSLVTVIYIND